MPIRCLFPACCFVLAGCSVSQHAGTSAAASSPEVVIRQWHRAAATGDLATYTSLMTDDVVFLGTDKTERWVGREFIDFCEPYFDGPTTYGQGAWTYEPVEQFVTLAKDGQTAWIDERLTNASYGNCRGTGVLVRDQDDRWKIAHYSLTFLVPNAIAKDIVGQIQEHEASVQDEVR